MLASEAKKKGLRPERNGITGGVHTPHIVLPSPVLSAFMDEGTRFPLFLLFSSNFLTSCAIAIGVACLDHEAFDDPVKDTAVIVPVSRMRTEVFDRLRTLLIE